MCNEPPGGLDQLPSGLSLQLGQLILGAAHNFNADNPQVLLVMLVMVVLVMVWVLVMVVLVLVLLLVLVIGCWWIKDLHQFDMNFFAPVFGGDEDFGFNPDDEVGNEDLKS